LVSAPRLSARVWLALAAGLGCGVCGYAGLYPRFDEGSLRLIVALTCAPFAAAVVAASLGATNAGRAFGRAVVLSAILGMAVTIIPAAVLTWDKSGQFVPACLFGAFFGMFTGAFYGLPIAVLCAVGHRHLKLGTYESTDRAARVAGVWLFLIALVGLAGTRALDHRALDRETEITEDSPSPLPSMVACLVALGAVVSVVRSSVRLKRRGAWIGRVRVGLEPAYRLRVAEPRDQTEGLPRLSDGTTVVEWYPEEIAETNAGSAYRMTAAGIAVAVVDARPLTA